MGFCADPVLPVSGIVTGRTGWKAQCSRALSGGRTAAWTAAWSEPRASTIARARTMAGMPARNWVRTRGITFGRVPEAVRTRHGLKRFVETIGWVPGVWLCCWSGDGAESRVGLRGIRPVLAGNVGTGGAFALSRGGNSGCRHSYARSGPVPRLPWGASRWMPCFVLTRLPWVNIGSSGSLRSPGRRGGFREASLGLQLAD